MIKVSELTKRYGDRLAVDHLDFEVLPGQVTGFLGPNGSGKSTTMRLILGLDRPTSGTALVGGKRYRDLDFPMRHVGAVLDARSAHPGRTGWDHLRILASTQGLSRSRIEDVLDLVELTEVADRKIAKYSLGMSQRLALAGALLGDPEVLILDEPVNGLDPTGVLWLRGLCRQFADEGRTVFLSSHLMGETAMVADRVLVLAHGKIVADGPVDRLLGERDDIVVVKSQRNAELSLLLSSAGARVTTVSDVELRSVGLTVQSVGQVAANAGIPLEGLYELSPTLEDAYLELTSELRQLR